MGKFGQKLLEKIEQNWTKLDNFLQFWTKLNEGKVDKVLLISFLSELDFTVWFKADADTVSASWLMPIIGKTRWWWWCSWWWWLCSWWWWYDDNDAYDVDLRRTLRGSAWQWPVGRDLSTERRSKRRSSSPSSKCVPKARQCSHSRRISVGGGLIDPQ